MIQKITGFKIIRSQDSYKWHWQGRRCPVPERDLTCVWLRVLQAQDLRVMGFHLEHLTQGLQFMYPARMRSHCQAARGGTSFCYILSPPLKNTLKLKENFR